MSDQQRLRDALQAAVPEPPVEPWHGADARAQSGSARRRLVTTSGALLVLVAVAGLMIWVVQRSDSGPAVSGSGANACHEVARATHAERVDDALVVDGATAATWLGRLARPIDASSYQDDERVTVCLTVRRTNYATYVVAESGRYALVNRGSFNGKGGVVYAMIALERVRSGGRATTDAPFECPSASTRGDADVSSTLPSGAVRALLCSDGSYFTPSQALTSGVDQLVRAINAKPLGYTPPNFNCSPYAGAYDYTLVFDYPTGTRTATWDPCRGMLLGSFSRGGPLRLDQRYLSLLARQVGSTTGSSTPPPCSFSTSSGPVGVGDVRRVVAARYCRDRAERTGNALSSEQLAMLRSWGGSLMDGESVPEHMCARPKAGWPRLVLVDTWGNRFSMVIEGCGRRLFPSVVDPSAPRRVAHPDGDRRAFLKVARQLGAG